jgi:L-2-hydroxyglutarate oxidase
MKGRHIAVIGGGVVGLAAGLKLARRLTATKVFVLEKEEKPGCHQTTHNSGVLHCGLYYKPGSAKAKMAVSGIRQMVEFCQENKVSHEVCGKLVVAVDASEVPRLETLYQRGTQNGLEGLRKLNASEMREIEPHVNGVAGLRVPQEGIVDYAGVCEALVRNIQQEGSEVCTGTRVTALQSRNGGGWNIKTSRGDYEADYLVNCAGLHCDRVAQMAGHKRDVRIIPFRGEYFKIKAPRQNLVRNLIYPVPDPQFPFLGVHFTRLIHGGIEAGPNAVLAFAREGYRKSDINPRDLFDALSFPGLWRFLNQHRKMSWQEMKRSFSPNLFCASLQRLVPEIRLDDLEPGGSGVRAQAMSVDGQLVQDFCFAQQERALHVLNAPSPAATASLAIGDEITAMVERAVT